MNKLAFISDIHGNFPALRAVWTDIQSRGVNKVYCLGDLVGYYSQINEVISFIREHDIPCLMGNHDYAICFNDGEISRSQTCTYVLKRQLSYITRDNLFFLRTLPLSFYMQINQYLFWSMHGGVNNPMDEYIYKNDGLSFGNGITGVTHLVTAHTHIPFIEKTEEIYYANSGSVGQPRDHINKASYLLFENGVFQTIRVPYDIDETVSFMRLSNFPDYISDILYKGCRIGEQ